MKQCLFILGFTLFLLISSGTGMASEEQIAFSLKSYVSHQLSTDPSAINVARIMPMNGLKNIFPGKIVKIRPAVRGRFLGRPVFVLTMLGKGGVSFEQWVSAEVEQDLDVVITRRNLRRFDVIGADDVALQTIRSRRQKNRYEKDLDQVLGKRVTQLLRKGVPVRSDQIEETPLVRRGDRVTVTLQSRGLQITTTGEAKEDGHMGETIKVINLDSRKMVFARVVSPGHVRIGVPSE